MNIIVTGASQGIGFELVKTLSSNTEHRIMAVARNLEALKKLQLLCREEHGNDIWILGQDLTVPGFEKIVGVEAAKRFSAIDVLVNNAGLLIHKPFLELTGRDFDNMFTINVKSPFLIIRELLPLMAKPSHIVNISSMGGVQGSVKFPGLSLYSASKGALATLTECLALEFQNKGIRVNCLALGAAQTEMLQKAFPGYKAPLTPLEMAGFIADFAVNGHRFFNGKILQVSISTP